MIIDRVQLDKIDFQDQRFRISEELDSAGIRRSLTAIGLVHPVVLRPGGEGRMAIVCGFRRLHALRSLGERRVPARLLDPAVYGPVETFRIALWDNLSHRSLGLLEAARAVHVLETECGLTTEAIVRDYLPALGLGPRAAVVQSCLAIHAIRPRLRRLVGSGRISAASAERLAGRPAGDQDRMADLLEKVRLSASMQREVLDLVDAISSRRGGDIAGVLDRPDIVEALENPALSPVQRGEKVHRILFEEQNPRLTAAEERFRSGRAKLRLTGQVRIRPEPYFETPRVFVEFEASSAAEFRETAESLRAASRTGALEALFKVW